VSISAEGYVSFLPDFDVNNDEARKEVDYCGKETAIYLHIVEKEFSLGRKDSMKPIAASHFT